MGWAVAGLLGLWVVLCAAANFVYVFCVCTLMDIFVCVLLVVSVGWMGCERCVCGFFCGFLCMFLRVFFVCFCGCFCVFFCVL